MKAKRKSVKRQRAEYHKELIAGRKILFTARSLNENLLGRSMADAVLVVRSSGLFDEEFYLKNYLEKDPLLFRIDPISHYLAVGYAKGYRPSPSFDLAKLALRNDVLSRGVNPLLYHCLERQKSIAAEEKAFAVQATNDFTHASVFSYAAASTKQEALAQQLGEKYDNRRMMFTNGADHNNPSSNQVLPSTSWFAERLSPPSNEDTPESEPCMVLIVPVEDVSRLDTIKIPLQLVSADQTRSGSMFLLGDRAVSIHELGPLCLGGVAVSRQGRKSLDACLEHLASCTGGEAILVCDLSSTRPRCFETSLLRFISDTLLADTHRQRRRLAGLTRSLNVVRRAHERTQASFSELESFVLRNQLARRRQSLELLPRRGLPAVRVDSERCLLQRLPISSSGLCDVALFIQRVGVHNRGELVITLKTLEDEVAHVRWTLGRSSLRAGKWLRLAQHVALEAAPMTVAMEISWRGDGYISLATSLLNPDPRFAVEINGEPSTHVLAMRCWSYLPDCEAPLEMDAILPERVPVKPKAP